MKGRERETEWIYFQHILLSPNLEGAEGRNIQTGFGCDWGISSFVLCFHINPRWYGLRRLWTSWRDMCQIKNSKWAEEQQRWSDTVSAWLGTNYLIISYCASDGSVVAFTSYGTWFHYKQCHSTLGGGAGSIRKNWARNSSLEMIRTCELILLFS